VNLTTRINIDTAGVVTDARIVLGSVAPIPMRAVKAEKLLTGNTLSDELLGEAAKMAREEVTPISDVRASQSYRLAMTEVLVRRALRATYSALPGTVSDG
jgi:carbon-monoxide dehydrogenase medium subunit